MDFADPEISRWLHAVWPVNGSFYHFLGQLVLSAGQARLVQAHHFWQVELVDVEPDHNPGARCPV
ncbi:hypothetical protein MM1S1540310_4009 [Mycobacteroides abscessus subsp. bolletii 1S-154-0310]|uniref:Uncharacterized protein n=2 Tax=Mycobacteroides abscessus TaxID=36809 RepID=A0A829MNZ9_9MYCO|nr:hypothetical protein MASS_4382 [Mycobacteroides abscessus subsp. bolletii 50594]AIC71236.1 hypothetical protein MYCMA_04175 [Mycobacteroides abscessus subsp. massiliense str. GO 06]AMU28060.1 hypothetical protein A3N96_23810 [Mycobacteroides abscessus]EHB97511.1 hypothetical protein MAB47J26_20836 [Mycobacteroides abscessus 47J26]EIU59218.1 hypothetical protein MM1S1510930_4453 [Mycobacteroides abscessus subsp. bolletii 1S-151-0930]EIU70674.1 hypothetical protein MM1S1520914_4661 [Mycobacte